MRLLGAFVVGAVGGPLLILALGYGIANAAWVLGVVAVFVVVFGLCVWAAMPGRADDEDSAAPSASADERYVTDQVRRAYRLPGEVEDGPRRMRSRWTK